MANDRLRFGPFTLDVVSGRLTEAGRVVRIQPQPLKVLTALVERPGILLSREDLRQRIWGSATFVEFDQGLNYCIRQIRLALRDDVSRPIYIETVKGQGYRFVAPVEVEPGAIPPPARAIDEARSPVASPVPAGAGANSTPPRRRIGMAIAGVVVLLTAGAFGGWLALTAPRTTRPAHATGSSLHQLTDFTDSAVAPVLSPDGRMVAFIRGSRFLTPDQIYVKMLPDGEPRQLTSDPRLKYGPAFSPDGSEIAYTVMENSGWSTYLVSTLGGDPHPFLTNAAGLSWLDARRLLFSEVDRGQHMGLVTGDARRADLRPVYFPAHERAMTHYAFASPDRRLAIVVEMDKYGLWRRCRLVPLSGGTSHLVGPEGACTAAAWSPDGRWMYFTATVNGEHHLWRQAYPDGEPEQLTSGPTDEDGVAVAPDGHSLITSLGDDESTLWLRAGGHDLQLSSEGDVAGPVRVTGDGQTIYYVRRLRSSGSGLELCRRSLATDRTDTVFPGVPVLEFDVSRDERQIVYSTANAAGGTRLWIAPVDGSAPATAIGLDGDTSPYFGPDGQILFRFAEGQYNYLGRMRPDGSGRSRLVPYPISTIQGISRARRWVLAIAPLPDNSTVAPVAIPTAGGPFVRICEIYCHLGWSEDGRFLIASVAESSLRSAGHALAIPVGPDEAIPALPAGGLHPFTEARLIPGARDLDRAQLLPTTGLDTYLYVRTSEHRNLFRLDLR